MNKYIKTDIEQGLKYLKTGIMNVLATIESGEEKLMSLEDYVPFSLVVKCAEERGWKEYEGTEHLTFNTNGICWYYMIIPNNKKICIESCLWKGQETKIYIDEND